MVCVWSREVRNGWGRMELKVMQDTTFNDLAVRLGAHYLFAHHGDCEHIMVVSDIRWGRWLLVCMTLPRC